MSRLLNPHILTLGARYIKPTGNDSTGVGTKANPWKTLPKALANVSAGSTILCRGGTYDINGALGWHVTQSGSASRRLNIWAYPGEVPIFDLANCTAPTSIYGGSGNAGGMGLELWDVSYTHWKGIRVANAPMSGWELYGNTLAEGNIFERCGATGCGRNGEVGVGFSAYKKLKNNLWINDDSWANGMFALSAGNSDGFQISPDLITSTGNQVVTSRAWYCGDDGFDSFGFATTVGGVLYDGNWAVRNGFKPDNVTPAGGNGNGFKLGGQNGANTSGGNTARRNLAVENLLNGVTDNDAKIGNLAYNNSAYGNHRGGDSYSGYGNFYFGGVGAPSILKNNVSHAPAAGAHATLHDGAVASTSLNNSWDVATGVTVSAADFMSLVVSELLAARKTDGSLPDTNFMRLVGGSDLIDKGVDVGLPYLGAAPDLGWAEAA
jgi:hypothetical protein